MAKKNELEVGNPPIRMEKSIAVNFDQFLEGVANFKSIFLSHF